MDPIDIESFRPETLDKVNRLWSCWQKWVATQI